MPSTYIPFHETTLKIERADKSIKNLTGRISAFEKAGFCRRFIEQNREGGNPKFILEVNKDIPKHFSHVIRDVVSDLRRALDFALSDTIRQLGGTPAKETRFPIKPTWKETKAALESGVVQGIPIQPRDFSFDSLFLSTDIVDPDTGRNDPMLVFYVFHVADKHSMSVPIIFSAGMIVQQRLLIATRAEKDEVEVPANKKVEDYGKPMLHVNFKRAERFKPQRVIQTLRDLLQFVMKAAEALAEVKA